MHNFQCEMSNIYIRVFGRALEPIVSATFLTNIGMFWEYFNIEISCITISQLANFRQKHFQAKLHAQKLKIVCPNCDCEENYENTEILLIQHRGPNSSIISLSSRAQRSECVTKGCRCELWQYLQQIGPVMTLACKHKPNDVAPDENLYNL